MLGLGAFISRQWPKAVERFERVLQVQPDNLEVLLRLADALEQDGNKAAAKKRYEDFLQTAKRLEQQGRFRSNPQMLQQIADHIKQL
jgi:uncharacterized protein HemY